LPSVSEPTSVAEAAQVVAEAARAGRHVAIGDDGAGADVVVRTAGLHRLLEHEAGDLTATVEAGMRLSALSERLARSAQMLALDPPGDPTLGACLAANLSGPLRHRYGTMRDLVIGVSIVLADGSIANAGGKVVKNVAGYDLAKLLCGSRGRLGLIVRLSVRLHPLPRKAATVVADVDDPDDASARVAALAGSSAVVPWAVDLLWPGRLAVLLAGRPESVERQAQATCELVGGRVSDDGDAVWAESRRRQAALPGRRSFSPGELAAHLRAIGAGVVRPGPGLSHVETEHDEQAPPAVAALRERVRLAFDPEGLWAA
jgi:glycolate oxidase FAD binding subunit